MQKYRNQLYDKMSGYIVVSIIQKNNNIGRNTLKMRDF